MIINHKPLPVIGFHGTTLENAENITLENFTPSESPIEWLGHGIYFWQDNPLRAFYWAARNSDKSSYEELAIVQVRLNLANCLDLLDQYWQRYLRIAFDEYINSTDEAKSQHPYVPLRKADDKTLFSVDENWKPTWLGHGFNSLDCEVVNTAYLLSQTWGTEFNSVRGVFFEGQPIYPASHFFNRSHAQICVKPEALPTIGSELIVWKYEHLKDDLEAIKNSDDFWKSELESDGQLLQPHNNIHFFEERLMAHIDSDQTERAKNIAECKGKTLVNDSPTDLGLRVRQAAKEFLK